MEGAEVQHVLVAVDDSEASEQAAEFVNRFFGDLDVVITAVNVGTVEITWGSYAAAPGALYPWPPVSTAVAPPVGPGGPNPVGDLRCPPGHRGAHDRLQRGGR